MHRLTCMAKGEDIHLITCAGQCLGLAATARVLRVIIMPDNTDAAHWVCSFGYAFRGAADRSGPLHAVTSPQHGQIAAQSPKGKSRDKEERTVNVGVAGGSEHQSA